MSVCVRLIVADVWMVGFLWRRDGSLTSPWIHLLYVVNDDDIDDDDDDEDNNDGDSWSILFSEVDIDS